MKLKCLKCYREWNVPDNCPLCSKVLKYDTPTHQYICLNCNYKKDRNDKYWCSCGTFTSQEMTENSNSHIIKKKELFSSWFSFITLITLLIAVLIFAVLIIVNVINI